MDKWCNWDIMNLLAHWQLLLNAPLLANRARLLTNTESDFTENLNTWHPQELLCPYTSLTSLQKPSRSELQHLAGQKAHCLLPNRLFFIHELSDLILYHSLYSFPEEAAPSPLHLSRWSEWVLQWHHGLPVIRGFTSWPAALFSFQFLQNSLRWLHI